MVERTGERADLHEAQVFPETHRTFIRRNHKIELHGAEAEGYGKCLRVLAESGSNPLPLGFWGNDITRIADVRAEARLVRLEIVDSEERAIGSAGDTGRGRDRNPGIIDLGFGTAGSVGAGISRLEGGMKQGPHGGPVVFGKGPDSDHYYLSI